MKEPAGSSIWKEFMEYLKMIIFVVIVVLIVNNFLLINAKIPSESMEQTIMTGDRVFGNRLAYLFDKPKRFDIVIFKYPDHEKELFIKRIIGMPEKQWKSEMEKSILTGQKNLWMTALHLEPLGDYGPYVVPEDSYFILGDNRNYSKDSRFWNNPYVAEDKILGKAVLRYFPGIKLLK